MAAPDAVNSQITDAVTQTNAHALSAVAVPHSPDPLASFYQAASHALGILVQNAVDQQQQQDTLQQAATNQGIMQIYSLGTAGDVGNPPTEQILKSLNAESSRVATATDAHPAARALDELVDADDGHGNAWSRDVRSAIHAVADSLRHLQHVANDTSIIMLKQAAIAVVLARIVARPEQLEAYKPVLAVIETL